MAPHYSRLLETVKDLKRIEENLENCLNESECTSSAPMGYLDQAR
jgi:heterodisulfide reductase subunit C